MDQKLHQGRACYRDGFPGKEAFILNLPVFDIEGSSGTPIKLEPESVTLEGVFDELDRIESYIPDIPPFEAMRLYLIDPVEVCPTSLMDPYIMYLLETEQAVREYHTLPFEGGLWDQPMVLLEAFIAIRSERNQYERLRWDRIEKKRDRKSDTGDRVLVSPNENLPPRQGPLLSG